MNKDLHICNTKKSKKDNRDWIKSVTPPELPKYTIRHSVSIRDQKNIGSCFPSKSMVTMEDLSKLEISKIKIGDYVLSHNGAPKKVTNLFKRIWQGNTIEIQSIGHYEPIVCTPEHPFYTQRGWVDAKDLTKKDMVFFPRNKTEKETFIYEIEKDPDFLWLLGLYLAEGSINVTGNNNRITFTLNIKEDVIKERIEKFMYKRGVDVYTYKKEENNCMNVRFTDNMIVPLIDELCGKICNKKKLNKRLMFIDPELQYNIYRGWMDGDGSHTIFKRRYVGATTSKELAEQMQQILFRNKIFCSITTQNAKNRIRSYRVNVVKDSRDSYRRIISDNGFFCKISSLKTNHSYTGGYVYNIEVEDDNSYQIYNRAVHNCMSHAAVRSVEIQLLKKRKWLIEGSELYHYYMVRKEINNEYPNDSGMTVRDGCKGIQKYGASLELVWPYNVKKFNNEPSLVSHWLSGLTKASSYFRLNDIETIKYSISCDIPVVCGVFIDDNYYKLCNNNSDVWVPGGKKRGGHAQICIGYDDNKKVFIIENSWGESFGNKGTLSISYDDFKKVSFDWFQIII